MKQRGSNLERTLVALVSLMLVIIAALVLITLDLLS